MDGSYLTLDETVAAAGVARIVPVVMSGGSGTRLWPLSTEAHPKQFHALATERTLLQEALGRNRSDERVEFLPPIVICNRQHKGLVEAQLAALGCKPTAIVLEPVGRNTAAVAAVAARMVQLYYGDALALLMPADQVIAEPGQFRAAIGQALETARDHIVTFGIHPTSAATGYGYIQRGAPLAEGVHEVARFVEKPTRPVAEEYCRAGGYTWNAGIFLFAPQLMLSELRRFEPQILDYTLRALAGAARTGDVVELEPRAFAEAPAKSIDVAVMERTDRAAVAPCSMGWADLGSWSEIWRASPHDGEGNSLKGRVTVSETDNSLVWSDGPTIAAAGLKDMIVVASKGAVVIVPMSRAQEVKALLDAVKRMPPSLEGDCRS